MKLAWNYLLPVKGWGHDSEGKPPPRLLQKGTRQENSGLAREFLGSIPAKSRIIEEQTDGKLKEKWMKLHICSPSSLEAEEGDGAGSSRPGSATLKTIWGKGVKELDG